jgi:hypothetical protein
MVEIATLQDLIAIRELDCITLPKEWHAPIKFYADSFHRNSEIFRVYKDKHGEVKGYYSLFPLKEDIFEMLMRGLVDEKEIPKTVYESPLKNRKIWIYIGSVIIHPSLSNRTRAAAFLIRDISFHIRQILAEGNEIVEIGTFGVSRDGRGVAGRFGLENCGEIQPGVFVFRNNMKHLSFRGLNSPLSVER